MPRKVGVFSYLWLGRGKVITADSGGGVTVLGLVFGTVGVATGQKFKRGALVSTEQKASTKD